MSADSRWHFDYFYPAMLAVFGVFTGGWVDLFQACVAVTSVRTALLFLVPAIVVTNPPTPAPPPTPTQARARTLTRTRA